MIVGMGVLAHAPRYSNELVWDDVLFRDGTDPVLYDGLDLGTTHTRLYRPLRVWAYTTVFSLSGSDAIGYQVFGTLIHALCSLAVFGLLSVLGLPWPLFGALLFSVHPVHLEAIVFVTSTFDQIAVFLVLCSLISFCLLQKSRARRRQAATSAACLTFGALALLGSEFAATLPVAALLLGLYLNRSRGWPLAWKTLAALAVLLGLYLVVRFEVIGLGARSGGHLGGSVVSAVATTSVIFVRYLGLLLLPLHSCPLYDPTIYTTLLAPEVLGSLALLTLLTGASVLALVRGSAGGLPLLLTLLFLGPVANIIPSTTPMAERYLYLASLGLAILAASVSPAPGGRRSSRRLVAAGVMIVAGAATSAYRTTWWRDDVTLFTWACSCAPRQASNWYNLAQGQLQDGDRDGALRSAETAVQLNESDPQAWTTLGQVLEAMGRSPLAAYTAGAAKSVGSVELSVSRLAALLRAGEPKAAEREARAALLRWPANSRLLGNLGEALLALGRPAEAEVEFREALRTEPRHPELWVSLADAQIRQGEREGAMSSLRQAVAQYRPSARAHFNMGQLLRRTAPAEAATHFREYLRLEPGAADAKAVQAQIRTLERP